MVKSQLPTFSTYGNYSSSNYGAHAIVFINTAKYEAVPILQYLASLNRERR